MRSGMRLFSSASHHVRSRFNRVWYDRDVKRAAVDANGYWLEKGMRYVDWKQPPKGALDHAQTGWFPGGRLNTCYQAVDRHVEAGRGGMPALIFESLVTGDSRTLSFEDMVSETSAAAHTFRHFGLAQSEPLMIYMPSIPTAGVAALGAARIGAPHCIVFAGFAPRTLAARIEHVKPKVLITADYALEGNRKIDLVAIVKEALKLSSHQPRVLVHHRDGPKSDAGPFEDFDREMRRSASLGKLECVPVDSWDPLYFLHTSGTTGDPKALVRENGGHAVSVTLAATEIFGLKPGRTMWAASDIGWVVGHSFSIYGPLFAGAASLWVEGKPIGCPDHLAWFRLLEKYAVDVMFCAPTAIRAIRKEAEDYRDFKHFNLLALKAWFVAGEKCPITFKWLEKILSHATPVVDNYWQTETGWPITTDAFLGTYGIAPHVESSSGMAVPGYRLSIDDTTRELKVKLPMPPGAANSLLSKPGGFTAKYTSQYPGFYASGDGGRLEEDHLVIMGRQDDVLNVSGHRLTTSQLEEVVSGIEGVSECAVVGVPDTIKGQVPVAFAVGSFDTNEVVQRVREDVGAVANLKTVYVVRALPKTRSAKILRKTLRAAAEHCFPLEAVPTIEDPAVLKDLEAVVRAHHK